MIFIKLRQKVPAQVNKSNGDETKEAVRKVPARVKVMNLFKTTEQVKSVIKKLALLGSLLAKQGSRVSSLIRIQIEETKRKVEYHSPAALRFIGPGGNQENLTKRGGINQLTINH